MGILDKLYNMLFKRAEKTTEASTQVIVPSQEPAREIVPEAPLPTVTMNKQWEIWPTNQPLPSTTPVPIEDEVMQKRAVGKTSRKKPKKT